DLLGQSIKLGRAYSQRPESFIGWYQYDPLNGDSAEFSVKLTKYNSATQSSELVGSGSLRITDPASSYTQFTVNINYVSSETPDTIVLVVTSSAGYNLQDLHNGAGQVGSTLYVDDIGFTFPVSVENEFISPKVRVYPTQVSDVLYIYS